MTMPKTGTAELNGLEAATTTKPSNDLLLLDLLRDEYKGGQNMTCSRFASRRTALKVGASAAVLPLLDAFVRLAAAADVRTPELESPRAKELEALVDNAASLLQSKGKAAFTEFREKGSKWFNGDTYLSVDDLQGNVLFNAYKPDLEGKNLIDAKDANGKQFQKAFIELLKQHDSGWVDYVWPKPATNQIARKWSYIRRVDIDGTPAFVLAGIYID